MLSEPQIQRYGRHVLLKDVGGAGQERLCAGRVRVTSTRAWAAAAIAYLRAGGTPVDGPEVPWSPSSPLPSEPSGENVLLCDAHGAMASGPAVTVRVDDARASLVSSAVDACDACLARARADGPGADAGEASPVLVGSLVALLVQRRLLGFAPALEGLVVSSDGSVDSLDLSPCTHRPPVLSASLWAELFAHLRAVAPDEGCGALVCGDALRFVPLPNAHAARGAGRDAFLADPGAWLTLLRALDATGERLVAVVHSHPGGPAVFSAEDRRQAAPEGLPLFPDAFHLVVGLSAGRAPTATWARWTGATFAETPVQVPEES